MGEQQQGVAPDAAPKGLTDTLHDLFGLVCGCGCVVCVCVCDRTGRQADRRSEQGVG